MDDVCTLTGDRGRFVKAHIFPKALTEFGHRDKPMIQMRGDLDRPKKRWTSWYDKQLVTKVGEARLANYDDWGVKFLRKNKLVWSSWDNKVPTFDGDSATISYRMLSDVQTLRLRLFLYSLLWRAAASRLDELSGIVMPARHLAQLRSVVSSGIIPSPQFYPVTLMQFSTIGVEHLWAPERLEIPIYTDSGLEVGNEPVFRFFIDGLIVLFRATANSGSDTGRGVGSYDGLRLYVQAVQFERSRHKAALDAAFAAAQNRFPEQLGRYGLVPPQVRETYETGKTRA